MSNMNTCSLECQVRYQRDVEIQLSTEIHQLNSSSKFTGGVTSTLILHPLDLIKIRFAGELFLNLDCFSSHFNSQNVNSKIFSKI